MVPGLVITVEELVKFSASTELTILDSRDADAFADGHLPGAVSLHPSLLERTEVLESGDQIPNQLRPVSELVPYLRAAGVSTASPVVVYDEGGSYLAARLWWALDVTGHQMARVLDGGYLSWTTETDRVSREQSALRFGDFVPRPEPARSVGFADLLASTADPNTVLCNALPAESFLEATIPGSVSFPYLDTYDEESYPLLRTRHELACSFAERGVSSGHRLVCFCNVGYCAAQVYLAARHAGLKKVCLYDGGMADWSARGGGLVPGRL